MHLKTVVKVVVVGVVVVCYIVVGGDGRSSTGRSRGRTDGGRSGVGGGGGGLNAFHQPRHPKVAHGILELLAIHVTFELFGVLLNTSSPVILDLVISSSRQVLRNFRPSDE